MDNQELKRALVSKEPVKCGDIEYMRVCEIVYKVPNDKLIISAGLLDKNENSIVYAPAEKVEALCMEKGNRNGETDRMA